MLVQYIYSIYCTTNIHISLSYTIVSFKLSSSYMLVQYIYSIYCTTNIHISLSLNSYHHIGMSSGYLLFTISSDCLQYLYSPLYIILNYRVICSTLYIHQLNYQHQFIVVYSIVSYHFIVVYRCIDLNTTRAYKDSI
jgi:hypothetical protein